MRVKDLATFITARERHREAKEAGKWVSRAKPDPIIAKYRFCNVRRNDDRVTKWIHAHYLDKWRSHDELWFALVVARLFNNESALASIMAFVLPFKPEAMRKMLHVRRERGLKNFNAAYIVSTNGRTMDKVDYLIYHVLGPMWQQRKKISAPMRTGQLANAHVALSGQPGLGSFMAAQVVADLKYANPSQWTDFHTFAASGPGSKRGLNVICERSPDAPWREMEFRERLAILRDQVNARLAMEPLTAQDVQNCLCEYFKYYKVISGMGKPKQLYPGGI